MSINIYIYNLLELNEIILYYPEVPPEMNLFTLFYNQLLKNYNIVNDINSADIAFIPIDYTKLIYTYPINYNNIPEDYPSQPPSLGSEYKKKKY